MTSEATRAASLIAQARRSGQRIQLPPPLRPRDAAQAYAIQDAIAVALSFPPAAPAWKVGAPAPSVEPNAAPIYEVLESPARVPAARMRMLGVEAEIAAVFGRALPTRPEPYPAAEVLGAIRAVRIAIELCDSRLEDWESADDAAKLADHQLNFALVLGDGSEHWQDIDFGRLEVVTRVDGAILKRGAGCHALGNPLTLLPWLANHARTRGGIAAEAVVTTGAWLGLHRVAPGSRVTVQFAGIGTAEVAFPD